MSDIIIYIIGIFVFVVLYFVVSSLKRTAETREATPNRKSGRIPAEIGTVVRTAGIEKAETSEEAKARNAAEARKVAESEALKTQMSNASKEAKDVQEAINASLDNNPLRILTNMLPDSEPPSDSSDGGSIKLSQINKKMYKKLKLKN